MIEAISEFWDSLGGLAQLLILVVPAGILLIWGFLRAKKKKDMQFESMGSYHGHSMNNASSFSPTLSQAEDSAKNYINQYKDSYPRESLKAALVKNGNTEQEVDAWLDKYM